MKENTLTNIEFELREAHKQILRILRAAGGPLQYIDLSFVIDTIEAARDGTHSFVRTVLPDRRLSGYPYIDFVPQLVRDVDGLEFVGLLEVLSRKKTLPCKIQLTEEGKRVAHSMAEDRRVIIRPRPVLRTTVFVASAFGYEEIDALFERELSPACQALSYEPVRVDMSEPPQTISEMLVEAITEAACVIADLTHARPSVYFEVGYAHGLGVPLLLTCRKDHHRGEEDSARVHFDLAQYKISYWTRDSDGAFRWSDGMAPAERLPSIVPDRSQYCTESNSPS
jgi:hypothetical protein